MEAVQEAISLLKERFTVEAVYLFGSQLTGKTDEWSDIDVAAFAQGVDELTLDKKVEAIVDVQMKMKSPLNFRVEIHLWDSSRLKEARPSNIYGHVIETGSRIL